jgi:MFS family permease
MLCSYPSMGALTDRFGSRQVSASGALIALSGTLPFALLPSAALSTWAICAALFVRGVGMGSISIPSIAAAYSSITKEAIPVATTAIYIVQRLGGPAATTALAIFLHARTSPTSHAFGLPPAHDSARAFTATMWLLCAFHGAAVLFALRLPLQAQSRNRISDLRADDALEAIAE